MADHAGGCLGPLGVGSGDDNLTTWGLAFGDLALAILTRLFVLRKLGRKIDAVFPVTGHCRR
jgi:hypothetical protein